MRTDPTIQQAIEQYKPIRLFALYSGGNDSLASTHYAMEHGAHEVIHIHTGIGVRATYEHARAVCEQYKWPYRVLTPPDLTYRDYVLKHGFPGPGGHLYSYVWLKERALAKLQAKTKIGHKRKATVGFITGVRSTESARRMGFVQPLCKRKARIWIAPLFNFDDIRLAAYIQENRLPVNPVTKLLGMSGECLCGSFAQPNEIATIERHFPILAKQIHDLEAEARERGVHAVWGTRPPKEKKLDQYDLPFMPMCSGCPSRASK